MKLQELRIGNWLNVCGENIQITGAMQFGIYTKGGYFPEVKNWIKPIELTEKWMIKFGFVKMSFKMSGCNVWQKGIYRILKSYVEPETEYSLCIDGINPATWSIARFYTVHQLQNIYFALTSEELTINQK